MEIDKLEQLLGLLKRNDITEFEMDQDDWKSRTTKWEMCKNLWQFPGY